MIPPLPAEARLALELYAAARDAVAAYHASGRTGTGALEAPAVALARLAATPALALGLASLRPARDDLAHHSVRTGLLAATLGRELGLPSEALADVLRVALVHEAGTASLPAELVYRAGALDPAERRALGRAPVLAIARILREETLDRTARLRVAALDGLRAPAALVRRDERGEVEAFGEAPRPAVVSRLLAIACVYDALTSVRPYRDPFTPAEALGVMWTELAGRFDPALLGVFQLLLGLGPVRVHRSQARETPVLAPLAPGADDGPTTVASISIAGTGTMEFALDGLAPVELAEDGGEALVVELAGDAAP